MLDIIDRLGFEVNIYNVPDLESFLKAVLFLYCYSTQIIKDEARAGNNLPSVKRKLNLTTEVYLSFNLRKIVFTANFFADFERFSSAVIIVNPSEEVTAKCIASRLIHALKIAAI